MDDTPTKTGLEISDDSFEEITSVSEHNESSSPVTPNSERIPVAFNFDNGSSDVSPNPESDSSYSELDSEAEAFYSSLNHHLVSPESMELAEKPMSYGELMKKFVQCEEELKTTSQKLQESEQENEKLKGESEKKDSIVFAELETARRELEMRNIEIETEKRRVLDLETKLSDSSFKFENLVYELEVSRECLDASDGEISKLKEMLCETQSLFEARIKESESRGEVLEELIKQSDAEKMETKSKELNLQAELNALKTDLESRIECIEALNKDFEKHKLRYDMLMAEKDGVSAELDNLKAEMRSRDIQIEQMGYKQTELESESGNVKRTVEELRAMVKELGKEMELQRNVISEGEEEKREAIRQLCITRDHYKSGYRELLQFLSSNNKQQGQQSIMVV